MRDDYIKNAEAYETRYGIKLPEEKISGLYEIKKANNGEAVLSVNIDASGKKLRLNSIYNPSHEAMVWAEGREIPDRRTTVLLCGFSTGVYLKELLKVYRPDTEFYIYEPDGLLFYYLCSNTDISELISHRRVHLFITDDQKNLMVDAVYDDIIAGRSEVVGVITPFYSADERFMHICNEVGRLSVSLRNFKRQRGREALKCRIYAWKHMCSNHYLSDIAPFFRADVPAIIVSAGPSLEKNAGKLKQYKGHAFILATDRSLSTLKKYGIVPDAVISVDAIKNPYYLEYAFEKKMPIICSYQLNIEAQKRAEGNLFFFDALSYEKKLFGKKAHFGSSIDMGGNVAGGAFVVLRLLGVRDIILVGQDLAYSESRHHADDIEDGILDNDELIQVEGVDGRSVTTNKMWLKYRDFFVRQMKQNPNITLIDATEGGAMIEGSMVMILDKVKNVIPNIEFIFEEDIGYLSDGDSFDLAEISLRSKLIIDGWLQELNYIGEIAEELISICDRLLSIYRSDSEIGEDTPDIKHFNELRTQLHSMDMNRLLEEFWVEDMYTIPPRVFIMNKRELAIQTLSEAKSYYGQLVDDSISLHKVLSAPE
ncbi:motility associated factor glycosyltransferase family protein [Butyrivibrio sp. JL13D10]|uniref:motility associated factor glycosyltransferase family protein n=1 Tax=Butyrivibrio sp. JL13D10 TaxID=3236815 RepID=UPI0038B4D023